MQEYRTIDTETNSVPFNAISFSTLIISIQFKMIESVTLASIHTNGQYGKASESRENNIDEYRLKFPFQIKPVEANTNQNLLRDFTGTQFKIDS